MPKQEGPRASGAGANTVWHVMRSIPPAVTYHEILMTACVRAAEGLGGGRLPPKNTYVA